ncbi:hypothetical protein I7I51_07281 [Histoplasma capsulatum]|uniref:Uncharacterized protein n=1 Tax=Ajellomyces capsulatus TaxID=5037 RepID=A0A8A1MNW1_AJECA|nr:hypothetical protein I7I51_07281 [Histoplasma capsulatum]
MIRKGLYIGSSFALGSQDIGNPNPIYQVQAVITRIHNPRLKELPLMRDQPAWRFIPHSPHRQTQQIPNGFAAFIASAQQPPSLTCIKHQPPDLAAGWRSAGTSHRPDTAKQGSKTPLSSWDRRSCMRASSGILRPERTLLSTTAVGLVF